MSVELDPEQDDIDYWRAYGLDCDPFADSAIEGLYFPGGDRGELLQTAVHIAQFSRQPVVFYGAEGIGKTSLLNAVANSMDGETLVLKLQAGFMTTREQIFAEIAHALGMRDVNYIPAAFRQQIVSALTDSEKLKTSVLLLVDDAHELIDKTLHALRELAEEDTADVRVLFFAATDGNGFLRPELDRSDVQQLAIQPLDQAGIEAYLKYRLGTAGYDGEFPFTDADMDSILNQSLGIPARIGRIAEQKMRHKTRIANLKQSPDSTDEGRRLPMMHKLLMLTLVLAVVLIALFWKTDEPEQVVEADDAELQATPAEMPATADESAEPQQPDPVQFETAADDSGPAVTEEEPDLPDEPASRGEEPDIPADSEVTAAQERAERPVNEPREPQPARSEPAAEPKVSAAAAETLDQSPIEVEEKSASDGAFGLSEHERQLLRANADHLTLQILSSTSEQGMAQFVRQHAALGVRYYARIRNGREQFVAVLGEYNDRAAAQQAIAGLPAALRQQKPWPRAIAAVQTEIRDARTR